VTFHVSSPQFSTVPSLLMEFVPQGEKYGLRLRRERRTGTIIMQQAVGGLFKSHHHITDMTTYDQVS